MHVTSTKASSFANSLLFALPANMFGRNVSRNELFTLFLFEIGFCTMNGSLNSDSMMSANWT